jgi:hypothetical protein
MNAEFVTQAELSAALATTRRGPGWNFKEGPVRAFHVGTCTVYAVPASKWVHWRAEKARAMRCGASERRQRAQG